MPLTGRSFPETGSGHASTIRLAAPDAPG